MAGGKGKKRKIRRRWIDPDTGDILEWDYQHGKIEKFNPNGKHLGEFDPETGKQTKPAKPGRTITPTMAAPKGKMEIVYYVRWYQKSGDAYIGEALLAGVDEQQVRRVFKLEPDEPPGDCLPIETDDETEWLETKAPEVRVLSDQYQYFVEASQP